MLSKSAVLLLTVLVCLSGCASVSRTYDLHDGMTKDEVNEKLGSPETSQVSKTTGKEMATYRLQRIGTAGQIAGGLLSFGMFPFLFPGKQNYYTLYDKDGKLIGWNPSSWAIVAQSWVGLKVAEVYPKWGVPEQESQTPDGGKAYVYVRNSGTMGFTNFSGGGQTTMKKQTHGNMDSYGNYNSESRGIANTDFSGSGVSSSYAVYCRISFFTDQAGVITSTLTEGNNCNY